MHLLTTDEVLGVLDKMVPGMQKLWDPLELTMINIWPLMRERNNIIEDQMDTLRDIITAIEENKNVDNSTVIEWGKDLLELGGEHYDQWVNALQASPLKDLREKLDLLNITNMKEILDESQMKGLTEFLLWGHAMLTLMHEISEHGNKFPNEDNISINLSLEWK